MVILHNAIKTIQKGVFVFFSKKNKNLFLLKKLNYFYSTKKLSFSIKKQVFL